MTHTPGPWRASSNASDMTVTERVNKKIAQINTEQRIRAAAPDLLAILQEAIANLDEDGPASAAVILNTKARAAIAKAKGE